LAQSVPAPIEFVGTKDVFGESGEPDELSDKYQISSRYIALAAKNVINRKKRN